MIWLVPNRRAEAKFALGHKANNPIDCASNGRRQEYKTDGQPQESANTLL